ncbi:hypothetical protein [Priestia aryabhattai]|uniref:hypothetical protein n=1 Tax=Priestia aryabhattai TaxID=412384 RepID=UPI001592D1FA
MLIFWTYIDKLNCPENEDKVLEILTRIFQCDFFTKEIAEENIQYAQKLDDIGEKEIYQEVIDLMREHPYYSEFQKVSIK